MGTISPSSALINVTNTGTLPVTLSSIAITGANSADFVVDNNTCASPSYYYGANPSPNILAPGGTCGITVQFSPTAQGFRQATVAFAGDQLHSPQSMTLTGVGTGQGSSLVTFTQWDTAFGSLPLGVSSSPQQISINNTGTVPLALSSISIAGKNAGDFEISNSGCAEFGQSQIPPVAVAI